MFINVILMMRLCFTCCVLPILLPQIICSLLVNSCSVRTKITITFQIAHQFKYSLFFIRFILGIFRKKLVSGYFYLKHCFTGTVYNLYGHGDQNFVHLFRLKEIDYVQNV